MGSIGGARTRDESPAPAPQERTPTLCRGWRGLIAMHYIHGTEKWWKCQAWAAIKGQTAAWGISRLQVFNLILKPEEGQGLKFMRQLQMTDFAFRPISKGPCARCCSGAR